MERYEKESEITKKAKEQANDRPTGPAHLKPEDAKGENTGKQNDAEYTPQENQFADGKDTPLANAFDKSDDQKAK